MANAESAPHVEFDKTKFASEKYNEGALAERKRIAKVLGRPELEDRSKFEDFLKTRKAEDEQRLKDQGKFQELADSRAKEAEEAAKRASEAETALREERFRNQFIVAAMGKVADVDLALSMTNEADRNFSDDGKVKDISKIIDRILTAKPILKAGAKGSVGVPGSGATDQEGGKNSEQIKALENEMEAISKKAFKSGRDMARRHEIRIEIEKLRKS